MHAIVIILLSFGFTAGVLFSTIGNEQISVDQPNSNDETEVVQIESGIDALDDSGRDSIFPLL